MNNNDMSKRPLVMFIIIIIVFCVGLSGLIVQHNDKLVKEDTEYLYYKEYKWFNLDSAIYKYHKPIIYKGKVIDKYSTYCARVHHYHVIFKFDNRTEDKDCEYSFYNYFNKGDNVKVTEKFYPYHELIYENVK